ncbi:MAG TPA: 6-phosphogluconolactonase [Anaeromyxobacter sp.]
MDVEVLPDEDAVARRAAALIAALARAAVAERGRFLLATSGGATPWAALRLLAGEEVPWARVHLFQVDERVAPAGHPERNLTQLRSSFLSRVPILAAQVHAMPVEEADLEAAAGRYAAELRAAAGTPVVLDLAQLGLGADGHTASLFAGDPALDVTDAEVAVAGPHQGRRRMTLTLPALGRARRVLWIVTGAAKAEALARLRRGDPGLPAARVRSDRAVLLTDEAAARGGS